MKCSMAVKGQPTTAASSIYILIVSVCSNRCCYRRRDAVNEFELIVPVRARDPNIVVETFRFPMRAAGVVPKIFRSLIGIPPLLTTSS